MASAFLARMTLGWKPLEGGQSRVWLFLLCFPQGASQRSSLSSSLRLDKLLWGPSRRREPWTPSSFLLPLPDVRAWPQCSPAPAQHPGQRLPVGPPVADGCLQAFLWPPWNAPCQHPAALPCISWTSLLVPPLKATPRSISSTSYKCRILCPCSRS